MGHLQPVFFAYELWTMNAAAAFIGEHLQRLALEPATDSLSLKKAQKQRKCEARHEDKG